jgi:hypothetical protein
MTEKLNVSAPDVPRYSDWFGYFFGHDLDFLHAELLALQHIDDGLLKKEAELFRTKWFDYRRMHPTKATYLLAHEYNKAYGYCMGIMKDAGMRFMKGFKGMDCMKAYEKKSFWRLRQLIDGLGIRYDFFLHEAMKWYIANGYRQPPRPSHIGANADLITDIMLRWEEECAGRIQWPKDTRYKAKNFIGHVDQLDWELWLVGQINQRRHPQYALSTALYIEGSLRIEAAIQHFPERVVDQAIAEAHQK